MFVNDGNNRTDLDLLVDLPCKSCNDGNNID
jgi:hypothetical protein